MHQLIKGTVGKYSGSPFYFQNETNPDLSG